jgi:hypothetical protein
MNETWICVWRKLLFVYSNPRSTPKDLCRTKASARMTNTGREIHPDVNSKNQPKTIKKSEIVILMFEYKRLNYPSQIPF